MPYLEGMTIAATFLALTLLALAVAAGALLYAALTCSLTGSDVAAAGEREARPFVLLRAPAEYRLGAPQQAVQLPVKPSIKVIRLRLDGTQDEAYVKAI